MEPFHLFVYGTLRRGSKNKFARLLQAHAQFAGNARIIRPPLRLGSYPGAVSSNHAWRMDTRRTLQVKDPRWILLALDGYEGTQFQRVKLEVQLDSGGRIEAWVYFFAARHRVARIPSGDWLRR